MSKSYVGKAYSDSEGTTPRHVSSLDVTKGEFKVSSL